MEIQDVLQRTLWKYIHPHLKVDFRVSALA